MKREFRKAQRYAVQIPCTFGTSEGKSHGTILNLSAHGCALTAERLPSKGSYLSLDIDLLNGEIPVQIELAGVRWVSEPRCGVEFIRMSSDALRQLSAFVLILDTTP
ncbi:MAG: PilZ domain-containing protein [Nitrospira sp.]|jgi:c-di-GMP-binding flagellar brake protein YcgR|nr:PilZ domain-containing protein [Nitrospira sp.]MDH5317306.1 PilZ domain-containing protein [Nitrospira sp.]